MALKDFWILGFSYQMRSFRADQLLGWLDKIGFFVADIGVNLKLYLTAISSYRGDNAVGGSCITHHVFLHSKMNRRPGDRVANKMWTSHIAVNQEALSVSPDRFLFFYPFFSLNSDDRIFRPRLKKNRSWMRKGIHSSRSSPFSRWAIIRVVLRYSAAGSNVLMIRRKYTRPRMSCSINICDYIVHPFQAKLLSKSMINASVLLQLYSRFPH